MYSFSLPWFEWRPRPRILRRRLRADSIAAACVERLEERRLLSSTVLLTGAIEQFRFVDGDGDVVDVAISGSLGRVDLVESLVDGLGDDDGVLEDGETIGLVSLRSPSTDFQIRVTHRSDLGRGDGIVDLGHVTATGYRFKGLVGVDGSVGPSHFRLGSLRMGDLVAGGLVQVDDVGAGADGAGLVLGRVESSAALRIGGSVRGRVVLAKDLLGTIDVGGALERGLVVGGNVYGNARAAVEGAIRERLIVVGFHGGEIAAGEIAADVQVLDNVLGGSRFTVARGFTGDANFVRTVYGSIAVGGEWRGDLTIGGGFSSLARLTIGSLFVGETRVYGDFGGEARVGGRTFGTWDVHGDVASTATIVAATHLQHVHARRDFHGRILAGGSTVLRVDGDVGDAARIGSSASSFTSAVVSGDVTGAVYASTTVFVSAGKVVRRGARLVSGDRLNVAYGIALEAATLLAPDILVMQSTPVSGPHILRGSGPFVITESGDYVLGNDLVLGTSNGIAISVRASDVNLDLAGHTIRSTAGSAALSTGVNAYDVERVTVRNGTIRGFYQALRLEGREHVVEGIRAEANLYLGLSLIGESGRLHRNVVVDHGGSSLPAPYTVAVALQAIGPRMVVLENVLAGTTRGAVVERVGLQVDAGDDSLVERNVLHVGDANSTFGMWVNAGSVSRGVTDTAFLDNVVSSALWSVNLEPLVGGVPIGRLRGNLQLNVIAGTDSRPPDQLGGIDLGDNLVVR